MPLSEPHVRCFVEELDKTKSVFDLVYDTVNGHMSLVLLIVLLIRHSQEITLQTKYRLVRFLGLTAESMIMAVF
jgi:hypothetical protein